MMTGALGFHADRFFLDEVAFPKRDLRAMAGRFFDTVLVGTYGDITSDHRSLLRLRYQRLATTSHSTAANLIVWHYGQSGLPQPRTES